MQVGMQIGAAVRRVAVWSTVTMVATAATIVASPSSISASGFTCTNGPGYDVRSGDSWYGIADRIEVSARSLVDANGATLDSVLVPGDRLCLPAGVDPSRACAHTYTVLSGDSWAAIAHRAGSSVQAVIQANGADTDRMIHPGNVICLPPGSSLVSAAASGASSPSSSSGSTAGSYTVVSGDSWSAIADRSGVTMSSLLAINGGSSADLLMPGDVLDLPEGANVVTAASVRLDAAPTQGPCGYGDTWGDARSGGRSHAGTDIFSGERNYVYAVVDGRLSGRVWNGAGRSAGNAWTLTGPDNTRYFYAHLSDFAPDLRVGSSVEAGQIIGWIGNTGNSSSPHLHFEIRPGGGVPVNPYSILRAQGGCNDGRPYTQPGGWVPDPIR
jgi:murein DD-endopeptidase MepM/ murein hydrolase activator NlpD